MQGVVKRRLVRVALDKAKRVWVQYGIQMSGASHKLVFSFGDLASQMPDQMPTQVALGFVHHRYLEYLEPDENAQAPDLPLLALLRHTPPPLGLPLRFVWKDGEATYIPHHLLLLVREDGRDLLLYIEDVRNVVFGGHGVRLVSRDGDKFIRYAELAVVIEELRRLDKRGG